MQVDSCQEALGRSCQCLKQNISTDQEPKNSAEKPMQLASTFSLFFSAASSLIFSAVHKLLLGFSQQLQKRAKIQMLTTSSRSFHQGHLTSLEL